MSFWAKFFKCILTILCGNCAEKILNKIDQRHFSSESAMQTYEGKLLVCSYFDEKLSPQLIFDTSQLDDKGLMALIDVNPKVEVEAQYFEDVLVGVDMWSHCIILIFWFCSSMLCLLQNEELIQEVSEKNRPYVYLVYIIGGPIFMISNVLEEILDLLSGVDSSNDKNCFG